MAMITVLIIIYVYKFKAMPPVIFDYIILTQTVVRLQQINTDMNHQ